MIIPKKKLKNGFEVPELGLGTWTFGGTSQPDFVNDSNNIDIISKALDYGITHIDTAEAYGSGHAEELVGAAIQGRERSNLFITSKVYKTHFRYDQVISSFKATLKRLQTEYLDLYLIHSPSSVNDEVPLEETLRALNFLVDQGWVKNIGVSNFAKERLKQAQELSKHPIVCNQVHYNLIVREAELTGLTDYCVQNDVFLCAYQPLARGKILQGGNLIMDSLCEKYKKTPAQVALNWLIGQSNIITIPKMSTVYQIQENIGAIGWVMDQQDIERLREVFPNQLAVSDQCPLR